MTSSHIPFEYLSPSQQAERMKEGERTLAMLDAERSSRSPGAVRAAPEHVEKLRTRAVSLRRLMSARDPNGMDARVARSELRLMDRELRELLPDYADLNLRTILKTEGGTFEARMETRAVGSTARANVGDHGFGDVFYAAAVAEAPLMGLASQVVLNKVQDHDFGAIITNPTAGNIVADGGSATSGEPTFGGALLYPHKYERTLAMSNEFDTDSFFDIEGYVANTLGPIIGFDADEDMWGGDGSTGLAGQPQGLLAAVSTTTAAGSTTVLVDDVLNLLGDLSSTIRQRRKSLSIICHPDVWDDQLCRETTGTSGAGGRAIPTTSDLSFYGIPVYLTTALAAPSTGTKPLVIGDFSRAYVVGQMALQVATDTHAKFDTDQKQVRVTMRCDGRVLNSAAARALVMA